VAIAATIGTLTIRLAENLLARIAAPYVDRNGAERLGEGQPPSSASTTKTRAALLMTAKCAAISPTGPAP
jgi:hypothetical protein